MFHPNLWSHDPYRQYHRPSFFALHTYAAPPISAYNPFAFPARKHSSHDATKHIPKHRRSLFDIATSHSDLDTDTDTDTTHNRLPPTPSFPRRRPSPPPLDIASHFPRTPIRLPAQTAHELRTTNEILILPSRLTHLTLLISSRKLRVAVAGDMRLREVVKQLLPGEYVHEARVYVRWRGEWVEAGTHTKVSDVVEVGEAGVRVDVGGRREKEDRGHGRERERGRIERMRVY